MSANKNFFLTDLGYSIFQVSKTDEWLDDVLYRVRDFIFLNSSHNMETIIHYVNGQDVLDALDGDWDIASAGDALIGVMDDRIADFDDEPDFDARIALTMGHILP